MASQLEKVFADLVASKKELNASVDLNLNLDIADSFDKLKTDVYLEFESAVDLLNKQKEKLLQEIEDKEKKALQDSRVQSESIRSEWSRIFPKIQEIEGKLSTPGAIEDLSDESKLALEKQLAVLLADTLNLNYKRKKLLSDFGPNLSHDPYFKFQELFEEGDLLGTLEEEDAPYVDRSELQKVVPLSQLFTTEELYDTNKPRIVIETSSSGIAVTALTSGNIVTATSEGQVRQWIPSTGEMRTDFSRYYRFEGRSLTALNRQGGFACGTVDGKIQLFKNNLSDDEPQTVDIYREEKGHSGPVESLCELSLDGYLFASGGSYDVTVRVWGPGPCKRILEGHKSFIYGLAELPGGKLASGSRDDTIKIWNYTTGECLHTFTDHQDRVWSLALLKNGLLASASEDKTIKIWNTTDKKLVKSIDTGNDSSFQRLCVLPTGDLAFVGQGHTLTIYQAPDFEKSKSFEFEHGAFCITTNAVGDIIVVGHKGHIQIMPTILSSIHCS